MYPEEFYSKGWRSLGALNRYHGFENYWTDSEVETFFPISFDNDNCALWIDGTACGLRRQCNRLYVSSGAAAGCVACRSVLTDERLDWTRSRREGREHILGALRHLPARRGAIRGTRRTHAHSARPAASSRSAGKNSIKAPSKYRKMCTHMYSILTCRYSLPTCRYSLLSLPTMSQSS